MSDSWQLKDKSFRKYISAEKIEEAVNSLALRMNEELQGKVPVFIVVLNGAFIFASDLLKKISVDCEITFVKLSSYSGTQSTGKVQEVIGLNTSLKGRTVVIIEDIVDTGLTLVKFLEQVRNMEPADIRVAACLLKPGLRGKISCRLPLLQHSQRIRGGIRTRL